MICIQPVIKHYHSLLDICDMTLFIFRTPNKKGLPKQYACHDEARPYLRNAQKSELTTSTRKHQVIIINPNFKSPSKRICKNGRPQVCHPRAGCYRCCIGITPGAERHYVGVHACLYNTYQHSFPLLMHYAVVSRWLARAMPWHASSPGLIG